MKLACCEVFHRLQNCQARGFTRNPQKTWSETVSGHLHREPTLMRRPKCTSHKKCTREGAQNVQRLPQQDTINMRLSKSIPRRDLCETRTSKLCALHSRHLFSSTLTFVRPTQLCAEPCPLRTRSYTATHRPRESGFVRAGMAPHCLPEDRSVIHAAVLDMCFLPCGADTVHGNKNVFALKNRKGFAGNMLTPKQTLFKGEHIPSSTQIASSETVLFTDRTTKNEAPNSRARGTAVSNCVLVLRCQSGRSREHARSPS